MSRTKSRSPLRTLALVALLLLPFAVLPLALIPLARTDTPAAAVVPATADYDKVVAEWRAKREAGLRAEGGWLSVAGLFWLKPGDNRFGSAADNDLVFPAAAPAHAGVFAVQGKTVSLRADPSAGLQVEGRPVATVEMKPDTSLAQTTVRIGSLAFYVIERQGRLGIRLKDAESKARREFAGLSWFPVQADKRIVARFVPYTPPKQVPIPNVIGMVENLPSPGYAEFSLGGRTHRLDPVLEEPGATELFFIFRDATSAKTTYGGGRFLYAEMPRDGKVVLDFNKAYTPPCGFTAYATCPLPPRQNRLAVAVEAGEKTPPGHH